ncbi:MAG: hypothetical protein EHM20_06440 [Alphaproteobacteria bacterium]|nr:MAG: hypothetical protein EHM20_06440 [Alphaproteobacteria bacterium]
MRWVNDPSMALALLIFGLLVNMIMGFLNGGQMFASLHVLLSLLALVIVPLNPTIFFVSAIIPTVGILMSYNDKLWDKHIIATSIGFFLIHTYWLSGNNGLPVSDAVAIVFCSLVGLAGILSHYRKIYGIEKTNSIALLAHLVIWGTFGVNLYAHSKGSILSTLALVFASVSIFVLSAKAKKHSVGWLLTSDRLISLLLILLATVSLSRFGLSNFDLSVMGAIISILFVRIISQSTDPLLEKTIFNISSVVSQLAYFVVAVQACLIAYSTIQGSGGSSVVMIIMSFIIFSVVFPSIEKKAIANNWGFALTLNKKNSYSTYLGISFGLHGALVTLLALQMKERPLFLLAPIAIIFTTFNLRGIFKNYLFDISSILGSFLVLVFCSTDLFNNALAITYRIDLFLLMTGISLILLFYNWIDELREKVVWPGVLGLWGSTSLGAYIFTKDQYPMLAGIIWLMMAMFASGIKKTTFSRITGAGVHERFGLFVTWAGIASIFLFIEHFFLFDIQAELWIGPIRMRVLLELFSLIVILYWWLDSKKITSSATNRFLNYFLELFIGLAFVFSLYEVDHIYLSISWISFSLILIFLSMKMVELNRLIIYSLFLYVLSLFHVGFISSTLTTPSILIYDQSWVVALITIAISISYLILVLQQKALLRSLQYPLEIGIYEKLLSWLESNDAKVLMYPLLVSVAFFLVWSFSNSVLSLLLIVECFVLFLVSILLRERDFRIISMAGIAVIFWRIIFYDLTGKDFFIKAIVFISVGAILIVMNAIYNKYKYRYDPVKID